MKTLACLALLPLAASASASDFALGTTRAAGMGNAGLAFRGNLASSRPANPALLAWQQRFRFSDLSFGYFADGVDLGDASDFVSSIDKGAFDADSIVRLARQFGDSKTDIGGTLGLGFTASGFHFGAEGVALVTTRPNDALQRWVRAGSNLTAPEAGMQLDAYGVGQSELQFGYGRVISSGPNGEMAVGLMGRFVTTYYSHHIANEAQITSGNAINTAAPEMAGSDFLKKEGFALDLGMHTTFGPGQRCQGALVINNLVSPDVSFQAFQPDQGATIDPGDGFSRIDAYRRTMSLGVAWQERETMGLAADLVGIGSGRTEGRFGADWQLARGFGARAGYSTLDGWTVGASLGGFNLAVGSANRLMAGTFFRF